VKVVIEFKVDPMVEKGKPRAERKDTPIINAMLRFKGVDVPDRRILVSCHDEADLAVARDTMAELAEEA
jgi:hypothetical protein